jgi:hypothetical protein
MAAALLVVLAASPAHGWLADLARIGKHARDIPLLSTSLDTDEEAWLHELNHRRSDPSVPSLLSVTSMASSTQKGNWSARKLL